MVKFILLLLLAPVLAHADVTTERPTNLHYVSGRFPRDPATYFVFFTDAQAGSSRTMTAIVGKELNGGWHFLGETDVYGADPRKVHFDKARSVTWTGKVAKKGDAHCCPTGQKRVRLSIDDLKFGPVERPPHRP